MPLIVNDKHIERISGPVSLHVFQPNLRAFAQQKSIEVSQCPTILLFGDEHFESKFECKECVGETCVHIYDDDFILMLNKEMASEYSITVFVETWNHMDFVDIENFTPDTIENQSIKKQPPLKQLELNYYGCFATQLKEQNNKLYSKICKASKINWMLGDPRNAPHTVEYFLAHFFDDHVFGFIFSDLRPWTHARFQSEIGHVCTNIFDDQISFLDRILMLLFLIYKNDVNSFVQEFTNSDNINSFINAKINDKMYMTYSCLKSLSICLDFTSFTSELEQQRTSHLDTSFKYELDTFVYWQKTISSLLYFISLYIKLKTDEEREALFQHKIKAALDKISPHIHSHVNDKSKIENCLIFLETEIYKSSFTFYQLHLHYTSFLLDTYLLSSVAQNRTDLFIAYVGDYHVENLANAFSSLYSYDYTRYYEVSNKNSETEEYRCVYVDKNDVNLRQLIEQNVTKKKTLEQK
jgi:hypothetical protein